MVHQGISRIEAGAEYSSTSLETSLLMLSENASGNRAPMLEIDTGVVDEARHGVRIEKISDERIFYLMTRGLSRKEAEYVVIQGFLSQQLGDYIGYEYIDMVGETIKNLQYGGLVLAFLYIVYTDM